MKTKKLELKHLAVYLPYNVQMYKNGFIGNLLTLVNTNTSETGYKLRVSCSDWWENNILHGSMYIPILRPISDLEKIHIFDGTKYPFYLYFWDVTENIEDNFDYAELIIEDCNLENIENYPYNLIQKLLEYHFDIFGLIPSGLAIDINTLNTAK